MMAHVPQHQSSYFPVQGPSIFIDCSKSFTLLTCKEKQDTIIIGPSLRQRIPELHNELCLGLNLQSCQESPPGKDVDTEHPRKNTGWMEEGEETATKPTIKDEEKLKISTTEERADTLCYSSTQQRNQTHSSSRQV
ncbi:hypothetical protein Anapl_01318 [Anas platyrhynchos]|uniref:Uncharacterized protein n=1 Tax=Anas platyrhynchos TaxID=8839 RepID=R0K5T9_ANAPL|nr:hypothetical protein Anapl_01318 [Anas platyrhynchos]